jgi:predicted permease
LMPSSSLRTRSIITVSAVLLSLLVAAPVRAEDTLERAGVVLGTTVGNVLFVPLKAISVSMGLFSGALSYVAMGGNREVTDQAWYHATRGPYLITEEVARKAIGERPELQEGVPVPVVLP